MRKAELFGIILMASAGIAAAAALVPCALPLKFAGIISACAQNQATPVVNSQALVLSRASEPVGFCKNGILLAYPHDGSSINSPATYMTGAVLPGTTLTVNGQPVHVNHAGYFAQVLTLAIGSNQFSIIANNDSSKVLSFTIKRPAPASPVPADPLQIRRSSLAPQKDLGLQPGDIIQLSMLGSPGATATASIGGKTIALKTANSKVSQQVNRDTAFGVSYQQTDNTNGDLYTGFYKVSATDYWQNEPVVFTLNRGADSVQDQGQGHITVIGQPFVAMTTHPDTVVRVGPGAGRSTPFAEGVRVLVDGFVGDSYRCEMSEGKHLWIEKTDLAQTVENTGTAPSSTVKTINIENEGTSGARVVVPLDQRLPYEVKQEISPSNKLILKIYGATADTDWITEPGTSSKAVSETINSQNYTKGRAYPQARARANNPVSFVTWQQISDRLYQVSIQLAPHQQWGHWIDYDNNNLILHIKGKPKVTLENGSLCGLKVCLDPGHGGIESGTIACSGTREATINLAIAKKAESLLKQRGAQVIMTRVDDSDVSLKERVNIAVQNKVDLLVSIHNNSLPDGRNPLTEHGTSSYYYHPQSLSLANHERQQVVKRLGLNDYHTRWQNLFLCRPTNMPAQLVEVAFLNNPDELAIILSEDGQQRAAMGIIEGIHSFLTEALTKPTQSNQIRRNKPTVADSTKRHR